MMPNIFVICFLLEVFIESSLGLQTFEKALHSPCTLSKTNESGICTRFNECTTRRKRRDFDICSFEGRAPIVCCPKRITHANLRSANTIRISFQECANIIDKYYPYHVVGLFEITIGNPVRNLHDCPYMSRIGHNNGNETEFYCGGSLISEDFVITAAHCRYSGFRGATNAVRLGYDEDFEVKNFINHPQYDSATKHNDIGLIQMNEKFTERNYKGKPILPACLHQYDSNELSVDVYGYGLTSNYGEASEILMMARLETIKNENCSKTYEDDAEIIESQVCAFDPEGLGRDSCQGDSGGPLIATFPNASFSIESKYGMTREVSRKTYSVVVGITSYGQMCGSKIPSVYTRVFSYLDWIESIVWADVEINNDVEYDWKGPWYYILPTKSSTYYFK